MFEINKSAEISFLSRKCDRHAKLQLGSGLEERTLHDESYFSPQQGSGREKLANHTVITLSIMVILQIHIGLWAARSFSSFSRRT